MRNAFQVTIIASSGEKRSVLSVKNKLIGMGEMESFISRSMEKLGIGGFIALRGKVKKDNNIIYEYNDIVGFNIFHDAASNMGNIINDVLRVSGGFR